MKAPADISLSHSITLSQDDDGSAYLIYTAHIQGFPVTHQAR
jgi:hypothetical protein